MLQQDDRGSTDTRVDSGAENLVIDQIDIVACKAPNT